MNNEITGKTSETTSKEDSEFAVEVIIKKPGSEEERQTKEETETFKHATS